LARGSDCGSGSGVRITIHRGARQIGGTCIELSAGGTRIVLDAGLPLEADLDRGPLAPPVPGLFDSDASPVDGLFLSHAHADHSGLISASRAQVPVWLTSGTSKMVLAGGIFARQPDVPRARRRTLVPGEPVTVGAFRVTAYPVDHSVYDAMAFLVEADGQRLLYTGDLRFHGRKPGMARQLARIAKAASLDALLIEGTRLGGRKSEANVSERDLEAQLVADLRAAPGVVLAMYSPLNVDRFVTYFRAVRKARRTFVIDPYQAFVLHLIGRQARLPQPGTTPDLRVLVPPRFSFSGAGRKLGRTSWARDLQRGAITAEEIAQAPERFVVLFRQSMQPWLYGDQLPQRATCIFSYWPGYLREPRLQLLVDAVKATGGQFLQRHASGHAHPDDLRRFVEDVCPRLLVPVHTTSPETWAQWWPGTTLASDGKSVNVG
jgi:ribonuclease J